MKKTRECVANVDRLEMKNCPLIVQVECENPSNGEGSVPLIFAEQGTLRELSNGQNEEERATETTSAGVDYEYLRGKFRELEA